jgi:hypothetical protein
MAALKQSLVRSATTRRDRVLALVDGRVEEASRNGVIQEVGIADKRVIRGHRSALRFFKSFSGG